jgi:hypothetical protein
MSFIDNLINDRPQNKKTKTKNTDLLRTRRYSSSLHCAVIISASMTSILTTVSKTYPLISSKEHVNFADVVKSFYR